MYTGIITHIGKLVQSKNYRLTFASDKSLCSKLTQGASIAINGTCFTISETPKQNSFSITIMPETNKRTNFGSLQKNDIVNLELPMTPQTFFDGHIVQGHIDGTGTIRTISTLKNSKILKININPDLSKYIVKKGSIAVNGISLTVIDAAKSFFTVGIIPHTWSHTMLSQLRIGSKVNIETDILGKYIEKLCKI